MTLPGLLHARILRSPLPQRPRAGHRPRRRRAPSRRARGAGDRAGERRAALCRAHRSPPLPRRPQAAADAALRLIRVDYAPLPFVVDPDVARRPERAAGLSARRATRRWRSREIPVATGLRGDRQRARPGNARQPRRPRAGLRPGRDRGRRRLPHRRRRPIAAWSRTPIVADWRADGLTVWMSTQSTAGVRRELADSFGLKLSQVRVKVAAMGGGFGSKSSLGTYGRYRRHAVAPGARAGAAGVRSRRGTARQRQSSGHLAASAHRRAPRRHADRAIRGRVRHGRHRRRRRRRQFRPGALRLPEFLRPRRTTCSSMPAAARRCAGRATRRAPSPWSRRSTSWPTGSASIRWRCANASTRARCGARNAASARSASAGSAGTSRAPMPARSSAASAWRSRCGAPMCRPMPPAKCACCATVRWRCCPACRISAPASAPILAQVVAEEFGARARRHHRAYR